MSVTSDTRAPLRSLDRFFIGGEWVKPSSDATIDVIEPATEELFFRIAEAKEPDISRAVEAARKAFDTGPWPRMTHAQRAEHLRAIAAGVRDRADDASQIWPRESGVLHKVARAGMNGIPRVYEFYADLADTYPFEERAQPTGGGAFGLLVREPVGVVGAIIPWNAPMSLIAYKIAPALLAGCAVVLKASPEAPGAAYLMAEVAEAVGLPAGVLNVVTADREVSELLVRTPASTRSRSRVRPRPVAGSRRFVASASRASPWSWVASRRPSFSTTSTLPRPPPPSRALSAS
jgi:aldehyde dehydrogenase (NAD+)